jgi:membrane protease YdiL (CAAX protease family)
LLETLGPCLDGYSWLDLLVLGMVAGISEEVLFRGVLQPWLELVIGLRPGFWVSNVIFGLLHSITPLYAMLAALVGAYLGWTMDFFDDRNLLTPVIIHSLYDFLAFAALLRSYRAGMMNGHKRTFN